MLLDQYVEVKINSYTVKYYESLGYVIPHKEANESTKKRYKKDFVYDLNAKIRVKIDDLPKNSNVKVRNLCDMCKKEITLIRYVDYNRSIDRNGNCVCRKCAYIRNEQNMVAKYGESYLKTDEFKDKSRKTMIAKYGCSNPLQNKEIMEKVRKTNLQKYGCINVGQYHEIREKVKATNIERYGYDNPLQNENVKRKMIHTNLNRYGVPWTMQCPEVREKSNKTFCKNGTQKTSSQQLYLHSLYGGEINYPISYYAIDICFPDDKLCIEYDGGGHRLRVDLGLITDEEFDRKEIIRNSIIKREGYKQMRIISTTDKLPSDEILLQLLSYAKEYFSSYPEHSWIEFNIDSSSIRNAEQKDGIFFNYGELRKIKTCA